jgi:UDP-glucose 4-epimerase
VSSGGAVYGETAGAGEDDPPAPKSPYGEHKLAAEALVRVGPGPAIARLANVYGPGQRSDQDGGVVAIFCEALTGSAPITIHGDGEQRRDLILVDDVVDALAAMLRTDARGTWNVATGRPTSINALVAALQARLGPAVAIQRAPARPGDVRDSTLRIDRIRADLGWSPRFDLDTGLDRMVTMLTSRVAG